MSDATATLSRDAALDRMCDPAAEVSAHWLVDEDGITVEHRPDTP